MKFTANKSDMTEAVLNIQRAVSSKTSIPALEGILINAHDNVLQLCAHDLELGMNTVIPARVSDSGSIVIGAKVLADIVRRSPSDTVTVSTDDKYIAHIESGNSSFSIVGIPAEEFPQPPKVSDAVTIPIDADTLKGMIRQTIFAVADNDTKPIHQGSLFNIQNGVLDMVSVDGYRLAKRTEPIDFAEDMNFVVPGKTLSEVLKLLKDDESSVKIAAGQRHIMFQIDNYTLVSSLLEGEFINYKATIPTDSTIEAVINTREAIESVERVSLLITDRLKSPLHCTFEEEGIHLLCSTPVGRASDYLSAEVSGGDLEIGFNSRYLLDALKNTECDEVKIKLKSPLSPMIITPKEGESFLFLVLPVRLKNGN